MAGRPKHRALVAELAGRAAEMDTDGASQLDYVIDWVASGRTLLELANEISKTTKLDITREMVSRYVNGLEEGAAEKIASARQRGASAMVEEAKVIVDEKIETREEGVRAKNRAEIRMWLGERFDRAAFGAPKQQAVQVNVNVLHLDAMRQRVVSSVIVGDTSEIPAAAYEQLGSGE
jgi:hypothetical protein